MGDLGADVVKVERPGTGDDTRTWGPPFRGEDSTYYLSVNRNKRSVSLNLSDERDLALARTLALRADVLVENFRPGALERLGLGYEALRAENPGLVLLLHQRFRPARAAPGWPAMTSWRRRRAG